MRKTGLQNAAHRVADYLEFDLTTIRDSQDRGEKHDEDIAEAEIVIARLRRLGGAR